MNVYNEHDFSVRRISLHCGTEFVNWFSCRCQSSLEVVWWMEGSDWMNFWLCLSSYDNSKWFFGHWEHWVLYNPDAIYILNFFPCLKIEMWERNILLPGLASLVNFILNLFHIWASAVCCEHIRYLFFYSTLWVGSSLFSLHLSWISIISCILLFYWINSHPI